MYLSLLKPCFMDFKFNKTLQHSQVPWTIPGWIVRLTVICTAMLLSFFPTKLLAQITVNGQPGDWPAVLNGTSTTIVKSFVHDAFQANGTDNSFTGGSSDNLNIPGWSWVYGNSNDKGDIANAGAALIGTTLYFFGDRAAVNGDAQIGFWFFHDKVGPTGTGVTNSPFSGVHTVGDLLLLSNFTNGGGAVNLNIYKWVGTGGDIAGGVLRTVALGTVGTAMVNTSDQSVPSGVTGWTYTSKKIGSIATSGTPQLYITGSFFEGSVNLATINADPCFTSFLLETRQSQSPTASLNDFVAGSFNVIPEVTVNDQIVCPDPPNTATFTATVTPGTGIGPFTYEWKVDGTIQSGVTGNTLTLTNQTAAHNISVVAIGSNGCRSLPDAGTLSLYTRPTVTASIDAKRGIEFFTPCYAIHLQQTTTAQLRATATGAATISYSWVATNATAGALSYISFTGATTATPSLTITSPSAATVPTPYVFTVTITDGNGCKATSSVCIQPDAACPNFDVTGPLKVCAPSTQTYSSSYALNTTDYIYTWSLVNNTAGATFSGAFVDVQSVTVNVANAGNYTVRLSVAYRNGFDVCGSKDAGPVDARHVTCTVTLVKNTDCFSNSGSATANPTGGFSPYTYKWDNNETTQTAVALSKGSHSVTVTDAQGCTTSCSVTIPENPCIHIFCTNTTCQNFLTSTQVLPQICYNTSNGTITPGVFYYWTSITAPSSSFTITVPQTNTCGAVPFVLGSGNQFNVSNSTCTNAGTVTYAQNATTGTVTVNVSGVTSGQTYILGLKYFAKSGATFSSTCTFTFVSKIGGTDVSGSQGQINVVLNCSATCVGTLTTTARAVNPDATVSDLQVHAYPNPFNSTINFNFVSPVSGKASLEVFDLLGRKLANVYQGDMEANIPQAIPYKVPSAHMVPMIYKLTVGDRSTRGTLLPGNQEP
jgi:hypothetical protein